MKKAKESFEAEIEELDYSKDLGIELDDTEGDEIIDLEEIVELPEEGDGSDDFNMDVELLDVDTELDLGSLDTKLKGSDTDDLLEDDLLKEFTAAEEAKAPAEPAKAPQKAGGMDEILGQGSIDDLFNEFAMSEGPSFDLDDKAPSGILDGSVGDLLEGEPSDLLGGGTSGLLGEDSEGKGLESLMDFVDDDLFSSGKESRSALVEDPIPRREEGSGKPARVPDAVNLEDFVSQIENRLVATIREVVEARLPEIVRSVLREEIERLKREL